MTIVLKATQFLEQTQYDENRVRGFEVARQFFCSLKITRTIPEFFLFSGRLQK